MTQWWKSGRMKLVGRAYSHWVGQARGGLLGPCWVWVRWSSSPLGCGGAAVPGDTGGPCQLPWVVVVARLRVCCTSMADAQVGCQLLELEVFMGARMGPDAAA